MTSSLWPFSPPWIYYYNLARGRNWTMNQKKTRKCVLRRWTWKKKTASTVTSNLSCNYFVVSYWRVLKDITQDRVAMSHFWLNWWMLNMMGWNEKPKDSISKIDSFCFFRHVFGSQNPVNKICCSVVRVKWMMMMMSPKEAFKFRVFFVSGDNWLLFLFDFDVKIKLEVIRFFSPLFHTAMLKTNARDDSVCSVSTAH